MHLPEPRGPISARTCLHLRGAQPLTPDRSAALLRAAERSTDVLADDDVQLSLAVLHELHHRGFDDVDDAHEWDPELVRVRRGLEDAVVAALHVEAEPLIEASGAHDAADVSLALRALVDADGGPSLSRWMRRHGTRDHYRELLRLRSVYHLKEADPQTWALPRLHGAPKAALVEIQADEYGGGRPGRMHSELFAGAMRALGVSDEYGAHWAEADATSFAVVNTMTAFGLNRRLRGAAVGQLCATEMTSSLPSAALSAGLRRLGLDGDATRFFDEHVEADAVHEQVAMVDLAGGLVDQEPGLRDDVLLGAASYLVLEQRFARRLLDRWEPAAADAA